MKLYRIWIICFLVSAVALFVVSCGPSSPPIETAQIATKGIITTVMEVNPDKFKISDEQVIPDSLDSKIIAKYLDGRVDTFSLAQARAAEQSNYSGSNGSIFRSAMLGYFVYSMGRNMMGGARPSAGAYANRQTFDRVNNTTGNAMRSSARTVKRPSSTSRRTSTSGSRSTRSTRSYGG